MNKFDQNRFSFDFNDTGPSFRFLGNAAGACLEAAGQELSSARTNAADVAGLRAARLALPRLGALAGADQTAQDTITAVCGALERAEAALARADRPRRGRPKDKANIEKQARAVIAVTWLRKLRNGNVPVTQAKALVAACIPSALLEQHKSSEHRNTQLTRLEQLEAWLDAFGRKADATRRASLKEIQFELWEKFYRTWREPVETRTGIKYSEQELEHDYLDITPDGVIGWLRASFNAI